MLLEQLATQNTAAYAETLRALDVVSLELYSRLHLCQPNEMELMAEALWALVRSAPQDVLAQLRLGELLLVQQREAIRKTHEFGPETIPRFACLTVEAASRTKQIPRVSCHDGVLRDWFLPQLSKLTNDELLVGKSGLTAGTTLSKNARASAAERHYCIFITDYRTS